jgi:hypothetical protein
MPGAGHRKTGKKLISQTRTEDRIVPNILYGTSLRKRVFTTTPVPTTSSSAIQAGRPTVLVVPEDGWWRACDFKLLLTAGSRETCARPARGSGGRPQPREHAGCRSELPLSSCVLDTSEKWANVSRR